MKIHNKNLKNIIMKTIEKIGFILFVIFALQMIGSCSKERTEKQVQTEYANLDDFYNQNQPQEQTFVIDSTGGDTVTGHDGTKIFGIPKEIFMKKSNQQDVSYPYTLKLIECYSIKNMILSKLPGVAQGSILHSGGELKITAFKNSDELAIKNNFFLPFRAPAANPVSGLEVYYGFTTGTTNDFNKDVLQTDYLFTSDNVTSLTTSGNGYLTHISKLGWLNLGKKETPASQANITFTATGTNTNFIDVYVVFNNLHNYIKVSNLAANNLPSGEPVTVFAIAKATGGTMYYFKNNYTISNGLVIPLTMTASTEAQVLSEMAGL